MEKPNNIHKSHRERMKKTYLEHGFDAFSNVEKLEFILFFAIARKDTNPIAHRLLDKFGSLDKVLEASVEDLASVEGMGAHSAMLLHVILDAASSFGRAQNDQFITGIDSAMLFAKNLFKATFIEQFYVVCLSSSNKVLASKLINSGTKSEVEVSIRDITKTAFTYHCERIIIMHNHPEGLARPSDEDITFTSKIVFSCIMNNIEVLDHIIVGRNGDCFSFESSNILQELKEDAVKHIPGSRKPRSKI